MSARQPRFEVVHSDTGWFARFRAANGQKVWQTESYVMRRTAIRAVDLLWLELYAHSGARVAPFRIIDERTTP